VTNIAPEINIHIINFTFEYYALTLPPMILPPKTPKAHKMAITRL